jgi:hypothetical protein
MTDFLLLRRHGRHVPVFPSTYVNMHMQTLTKYVYAPFLIQRDNSFKIWPIWCFMSRSEWLRGLRRRVSSPAQTLGLWVRIPLNNFTCVCFYSVLLLFVGNDFATDWLAHRPFKVSYRLMGWSPVQGVLPTDGLGHSLLMNFMKFHFI